MRDCPPQKELAGKPSMRRFVIGDIHGCAKALRSLIEIIAPEPEDELIFLGDYVDRGPDSKNVVDQLIELKNHCNVITLRGNHEIMLMGVAFGGLNETVWRRSGGLATVSSYGGSLNKIPPKHLIFFRELRAYYETEDYIFVHANYEADLPMSEQTELMLYWTHLSKSLPAPHVSGKKVFVGHTPQPFGQLLDHGHVVCVDTYCFGNGYLTALEIETGSVIQVDRHGHHRIDPLAGLIEQLTAMKNWLAALFMKLRRKTTDSESNPENTVDENQNLDNDTLVEASTGDKN